MRYGGEGPPLSLCPRAQCGQKVADQATCRTCVQSLAIGGWSVLPAQDFQGMSGSREASLGVLGPGKPQEVLFWGRGAGGLPAWMLPPEGLPGDGKHGLEGGRPVPGLRYRRLPDIYCAPASCSGHLSWQRGGSWLVSSAFRVQRPLTWPHLNSLNVSLHVRGHQAGHTAGTPQIWVT